MVKHSSTLYISYICRIKLWNHISFSINMTMKSRIFFKPYLGFSTLGIDTLTINATNANGGKYSW